jgi:protein TonB
MALMAAGALGLLLLLGGASIWLLRRGGARPPSPPPITPEMQAAMERVQGLEAQLKALQDEKAAAEAKAAQEAKAKLEAQARARGQAVDPAALQRVQEDAARRARDEQDRRNQGVLQQLEQQRQAEQARIEQRQAEAAAGATPVTLPTATPPTPAPTPAVASVTTPEPVAVEPTPTAAPAEAAPVATPTAGGGALIPPILQSAPRVSYPPVALRQRVEGVVEIRAFVNEQGVVTETQLQRGIAGRVGLNEAAIENVRQRRYKPATRDGEPTGAWVTVRVEFRLPR